MSRSFCLISLATNMLESWDIFHLKGVSIGPSGVQKTFLYVLREPRYEKNKMKYQISKIWNNDLSNIFKSNIAAIDA